MALVIFSGVAVPRPAQQAGMQHDVGLASQPKEWMAPRLVMHKYFMPSPYLYSKEVMGSSVWDKRLTFFTVPGHGALEIVCFSWGLNHMHCFPAHIYI